ncbi:MAG: alginate export family protein [Micavibrio aeruginosavorus]|uniref:Alginate export family protein n=1 Tax=Micavibrio aeruginosavorus TaxID=349221 RepID=A0A7T5UIS5_9BACT|nr:MAG: alginate export family protein [Micavibrio aeruginosavorus]
MTSKNKTFLLICLATSSFLAPATIAQAGDSSDFIKKGTFYGDIRYRYETVDQDGPAPVTAEAHASTLRVRTGFKTGVYQNFQALIEGDFVANLGDGDYNDGLNGRTQYPTIADPETEELNQLWLSWTGLPETTIKAGRQIINLDNQRFIGSVGWRQNDQTFDALSIENKSIKDLSLMYAYIRTVNRIYGTDHSQGNWDGPVHIAHATYAHAPWLNLTGYGYWMDFELAPTSSSRTLGLRLTGETPLSDSWKLAYEAEAATQSDHGNNTANYDESYYYLSPALKYGGWTLGMGYESLGGDGTSAFQTPLATLHAFNGWADKFLTTPANGLEDKYAKVSYKVNGAGAWLDNTVLDLVYHDYDAEDTSSDYGSEWNLQASRTFKTEDSTYPFKEWSVSIKYADYDADDLYTDTEKLWLTLGTKF